MKTRWIEKRQTPPHNNQDTFTKKKRQSKGEGKERRKKETEKLSFHITHRMNRIFLFFLYERSICIYFLGKYENTRLVVLLFSNFFMSTRASI
jgi:hypothetical protein